MLATQSTLRPAAVPATDRFIDDVEAAEMLGLSRSYLRQLRLRGGGCRFSRFGRAVRYRVGDLLAWANDNSASSTSEAA
ncbi:helix-turn-helix domain-containing protein [Brevundimonas albigilva]|jgi:excisionase family DNA binding protein|uniref:Helix-turn-helix domain-containing protein n=1 Tax=Brevundimonas albigilva TaxID=1312364 RepID=A0ABY4SK21_9CAUL|nr:helix-turn-helix domain-containing protein [Brevundimonas albigilva]UQV19653.1 helix-turn-helix domain-containing protein [Brevundimonas albigilva]URI15320.1 helix-turn-helix domain-containing protein [Brevundimonas albigilva]